MIAKWLEKDSIVVLCKCFCVGVHCMLVVSLFKILSRFLPLSFCSSCTITSRPLQWRDPPCPLIGARAEAVAEVEAEEPPAVPKALRTAVEARA